MNLEIKLEDNLLLPIRAHPYDAGLDLKSSIAYSLAPNEMKMIDTGVAVKIPKGYVGLVYVRSSVGKAKVTLANAVGVIDESYRGNIKVMLFNHGNAYFDIKRYDRIAQLVITPILLTNVLVHDGTEEAWNDSERGEGGFGSTGKQ